MSTKDGPQDLVAPWPFHWLDKSFPASDLGSVSAIRSGVNFRCVLSNGSEFGSIRSPQEFLGFPPFPPFLATAVGRHSFLLVLAGVRCCRVSVGFETRSTTYMLPCNKPSGARQDCSLHMQMSSLHEFGDETLNSKAASITLPRGPKKLHGELLQGSQLTQSPSWKADVFKSDRWTWFPRCHV